MQLNFPKKTPFRIGLGPGAGGALDHSYQQKLCGHSVPGDDNSPTKISNTRVPALPHFSRSPGLNSLRTPPVSQYFLDKSCFQTNG